LEKIIDAERKRGQQAIDYVKRTLNAKLKFMEFQLEEGRENVTNYSKDKRALDKDLKSAIRELEEEQGIATGLSLRVGTLERTIKKVEEETERGLIGKELLDEQNYSLKREKDTLRAQLDAALFVNEKLNAELPKPNQISDEQQGKDHPQEEPNDQDTQEAI